MSHQYFQHIVRVWNEIVTKYKQLNPELRTKLQKSMGRYIELLLNRLLFPLFRLAVGEPLPEQLRGGFTCCSLAGVSNGMDEDGFDKLYRNAYNMILRIFGKLLYSGLVATIPSRLRAISRSIEAAQRGLLLEGRHWKWTTHNEALLRSRDIFMYMDNTFITPPVYALGLHLWKIGIFHSNKIQSRLNKTLLGLVFKKRSAEIIDGGLMGSILTMLMGLGVSFYIAEFAQLLPEVLANLNKREFQRFIECAICGDSLRKAEHRLKAEIKRVPHYLFARSDPNVVEKESDPNLAPPRLGRLARQMDISVAAFWKAVKWRNEAAMKDLLQWKGYRPTILHGNSLLSLPADSSHP